MNQAGFERGWLLGRIINAKEGLTKGAVKVVVLSSGQTAYETGLSARRGEASF